MLKSLVSLTTACALALTAPLAFADPEDPSPAPAQPVVNDAPPPPDGAIASAEPGNLITPDGWTVTVVGKNESMLPVAPLTTALSSREYIVGGTFAGAISGSGKTKLAGGSLEAGYQIGCGIMGGPVEMTAGIGVSPSFNTSGFSGVSFPISGQIKVDLKPGQVTIVPVNKKAYEGKTTRTTITGFRIKIDSCVGQSFIRSYATMTSSTDNTDDVITYMGITKAV
ncbi:MspA family porin [Mycobacteroides abscessus]|uniref:MspA family porin n=1 Tax=Mycobacteroides abscessus TaxID=36809 RepID=UPI0005E5F61F|nr:MspA family porin [Mycobacteroides abscessus]MDO3201346.1 MspA family porin [Mycobacteroides abscessus subsp. abscessus]MDO3336863.1 MspA family porin [Mycobacteroides abscessus subsp. abscessus]PVB43338.1 MspA protein [Mycobacteroides abscessus]RIU19732.1 MspA protein [Mycobacteroides abscessus]CPR74489.1 MspA protein [Mycobacteroides abscessus]